MKEATLGGSGMVTLPLDSLSPEILSAVPAPQGGLLALVLLSGKDSQAAGATDAHTRKSLLAFAASEFARFGR